MADKVYTSNNNYKLLEYNGFEYIIPPRKNMKLTKHINIMNIKKN